jgi:hypothetical protein
LARDHHQHLKYLKHAFARPPPTFDCARGCPRFGKGRPKTSQHVRPAAISKSGYDEASRQRWGLGKRLESRTAISGCEIESERWIEQRRRTRDGAWRGMATAGEPRDGRATRCATRRSNLRGPDARRAGRATGGSNCHE